MDVNDFTMTGPLTAKPIDSQYRKLDISTDKKTVVNTLSFIRNEIFKAIVRL